MEYSLNSFELLGPSWQGAETMQLVHSERRPLPWDQEPTAILPEPWHSEGPPAVPGHLRTVRPRQVVSSRPSRALVVPEPEPDARQPYEEDEAAWFEAEEALARRETGLPLWSLLLTAPVTAVMLAGLALLVLLT